MLPGLIRFFLVGLACAYAGGAFALEGGVSVAGGLIEEGGHQRSSSISMGLEFKTRAQSRHYWQGGLQYAKNDMTYYGIPFSSLSGGSLTAAKVETHEDKLEYYLFSSHSLMDTRFNWQIGYRGTILDNEFSAFHLGGPLLGVETEIAGPAVLWHFAIDASPNLLNQVDNRATQFYAIAGSKSISIYGDPLWVSTYHAWRWINWSPSIRLGIGYSGEAIIFESIDRYYNYLALALRF